MAKYLFLGAITSIILAVVLKIAGFFILAIILFIFVILEIFQSKKDKDLTEWKEEVENGKVNTIEDWHDYEHIPNEDLN